MTLGISSRQSDSLSIGAVLITFFIDVKDLDVLSNGVFGWIEMFLAHATDPGHRTLVILAALVHVRSAAPTSPF